MAANSEGKSRGTKPAKAKVTQSTRERQAVETNLQKLLAKLVPAHKRLIGAMRRCLQKRLPTAHEVVYEYRDFIVISYSPSERGYEGILGIRASPSSIRLFFNWDKDFYDPEKLLKGSGKQTRWIAVDGLSTLARPQVTSLIDEAVTRNSVCLETHGRGSVVIRSQKGK